MMSHFKFSNIQFLQGTNPNNNSSLEVSSGMPWNSKFPTQHVKLSLSPCPILRSKLQNELLNVLIISAAVCLCSQFFNTLPCECASESGTALSLRMCMCWSCPASSLQQIKEGLPSLMHTHNHRRVCTDAHTSHALASCLHIFLSSFSAPSGLCLIPPLLHLPSAAYASSIFQSPAVLLHPCHLFLFYPFLENLTQSPLLAVSQFFSQVNLGFGNWLK